MVTGGEAAWSGGDRQPQGGGEEQVRAGGWLGTRGSGFSLLCVTKEACGRGFMLYEQIVILTAAACQAFEFSNLCSFILPYH